MRVKRILVWLKSELEKNFRVKKSYIVQLQPDMPGNTADKLVFEDESGFCVDIDYWDTGVVMMGACEIGDEDLIVELMYFPNDFDYQRLYPKASEEIFVRKVNELLFYLHNRNSNVTPALPDSF